MTAPTTLPFIDLAAQRRRLGPELEEAILRVVRSGGYILGPEVERLEAELASFSGAKHAISCSSGTDALALVLMAKGVGPGDAVLCPSFTYTATAEVVARAGATPIFADVDVRDFNLAVSSLPSALHTARDRGLRPVGVLAVDLFGQPADYEALEGFCAREGLWLLADAAQSFGAASGDRNVGTFGFATTTSFFPAKPLGCYGDGGAVLTDDPELDDLLRSLRFHGLSPDKTDHLHIGMTGRLDAVQAAVLLQKLTIFADEIAARQAVADRYAAGLRDLAIVPDLMPGRTSVWAQYTIRLRPGERAGVATALRNAGIPTAVYYAKPIHRLAAYREFPIAADGLPVTEQLAEEVISLPMHPYLEPATQDRIVEALRAALGGLRRAA
jgi:dTDP-4-amino-4,6-dideoxygalactose transaminase